MATPIGTVLIYNKFDYIHLYAHATLIARNAWHFRLGLWNKQCLVDFQFMVAQITTDCVLSVCVPIVRYIIIHQLLYHTTSRQRKISLKWLNDKINFANESLPDFQISTWNYVKYKVIYFISDMVQSLHYSRRRRWISNNNIMVFSETPFTNIN